MKPKLEITGNQPGKARIPQVALHPVIFSISWILLYFIGLDLRTNFLDLILVLSISVLATCLIWFLLYKLLHSISKSSVLASTLVIGLLYFDGIYELIYIPKFIPQAVRIFFTTLTGQYTLLLIILLMSIGIFFILKRAKKELRLVSLFLDITAIVLLLNFSTIIIRMENAARFDNLTVSKEWEDYVHKKAGSMTATKAFSQDIYYLVFDAYGGQDILQSHYDHSNQELIELLERQGFFVQKNGRTNYDQTRFSISASLNIDYWQNFSANANFPMNSSIPKSLCIDENVVFRFLQNNGYKTVTFATGLDMIDVATSDFYFRPKVTKPLINSTINNTFLALFFWKSQHLRHSKMIEYALDTISRGLDADTPVFVYAHIMLPHPPFIYTQNGEISIPRKKFDLLDNSAFIYRDHIENYVTGYRNQVSYADKRIMEIVTSIRAQSPEAIIVLQGDHGPGSHFKQEDTIEIDLDEKYHILNAIYFPNQNYSLVTEGMTPVNTFRIIFNQFFGTNFSILENNSYHSTWSMPFDFIDVTKEIEK
jgi:hypothetical protein